VASATETPRFTADELLAVAAEDGLEASRRLITDWVSLGLLDRPFHPGRGRTLGGYEKGTWPIEQAQLFVDLLALRQRPDNPVMSVAALANVPVAGWLWMAEASGVPLRQVRRALATWCGHHRSRKSVAASRARKLAREMLKQFDNPHATRVDRQALVEVLATSIRDRTFDREKTTTAVERVFDPHGVGRALGPEEVKATANGFARMLEAQASGYLELTTFSDQEFGDARVIYRQGRREYTELQPRFVSNRQGSPLNLDDVSFESVLNSACRNLLFLLGLGRLEPRGRHELANEAREVEANRNAA
jgi:hypothetical protein